MIFAKNLALFIHLIVDSTTSGMHISFRAVAVCI